MMIYHGTCASLLDRVKRYGIIPRRKRPSRWPEYPSRPGNVYLTRNYGIHFAKAASEGRDGLLLGVDYTRLNPDRLYADEDAIQQALNLDPMRISLLRYRRLGYGAQWSLDVLGNCSHRGTIRPQRAWVLKNLHNPAWLMLSDPSITLMNHTICGKWYNATLRWIAQGCDGGMPQLVPEMPYFPTVEEFIRKNVEEVDV